MAKKIQFIKKNAMKEIVPNAMQFVARSAGAVGGAFISNKVLKDQMPKIKGPIAMALGLAGDLFIEEKYSRSFLQGIGAYGALETTGLIAGEKKVNFGLAGTSSFTGEESNNDSTEEAIGELDWQAMADQLMKENKPAGTRGVDDDDDDLSDIDDEDMKGIEEDMASSFQTPAASMI